MINESNPTKGFEFDSSIESERDRAVEQIILDIINEMSTAFRMPIKFVIGETEDGLIVRIFKTTGGLKQCGQIHIRSQKRWRGWTYEIHAGRYYPRVGQPKQIDLPKQTGGVYKIIEPLDHHNDELFLEAAEIKNSRHLHHLFQNMFIG